MGSFLQKAKKIGMAVKVLTQATRAKVQTKRKEEEMLIECFGSG